MNCRKCGNLLNENDTFCKVCGEAVNNGQVMGSQPVQQPMQQPMQQPVQPQMMQQPQQPMQQPNYGMPNNMMGQNSVQPAPNKSGSSFVIILVILLVAIAGLGAFIGYKVLSNNETKQVDKEKDNKTKDTDRDKDKDKEKEPEKPVIAENKNVFEISGYKFTIPSELKYQNESGMLTISDSKTFQANFSVDYYKYEDVVANPQSVAEEIKAMGVGIVNSVERNIGGRKFYLYQIQYTDVSAIFYLTKLDTYTSAMGVAMATTTSGYEKCLEYVGKMVDGVDKTSSFAPGEEKDPHLTLDNKIFDNKEIASVVYPVQ